MSQTQQQIKALLQEGLDAFDKAPDTAALEEARIAILGRKGPLAALSQGMKDLDPEAKRTTGKELNKLRKALESSHNEKAALLRQEAESARLQADRLDVTLPPRSTPRGFPHPLRMVEDQILDAFIGLGYTVAEGPEVETDWYNFQALNIPEDHPARSMQDTLYLDANDLLLRTHTSPVQIREMKKGGPPIAIVVPGRVYRRDPFDATHSPCFHQVEGLFIDKRVTFADLKGTLAAFARSVLGEDQRIRMRPSYFPFTEPSAEVDVLCVRCKGSGCASCSRSGWMEIMGAGMVHPEVLRSGGYSPDEVTGFAFGMGIERIAMLVHELPDIRMFFENDARFAAGFHA